MLPTALGRRESELEIDFFGLLTSVFDDVLKEWPSTKHSRDDLVFGEQYAPRPDFVVGPFNIDKNHIEEANERIANRFHEYEGFIHDLESEDRTILPNKNPRCFLSVEIESGSNTAKHMMGSMINASALGKVGIIVGVNSDVYKTLINIRKYLGFLKAVEKTTYAPENSIILTAEKFEEVLLKHGERRPQAP